MEGKATFTLTDAATGKTVKQFTEHNIVTDAVKRILDPPGYTLMYNFNYSDFLKNMLPLSQSLFGGIVLLGNTMEESVGNVMFNKNCIPIATAGSPYSGTNIMRGTLNKNECYATENGYHFTWDFGTDKANGTIKCAALTSRVFGDTGFAYEDKTGTLMMNPLNVSLPAAVASVQYLYAQGQYIGTFENQIHTYFRRISGDTRLEFVKIKSLDPEKIGINDSTDSTVYAEPFFSTLVEIPINYNIYTRWFINKETKVMYFFTDVYNDNGQYKIDYAGVSLTDFTIADTGTRILSCKYSSRYATAIYDDKLFIAGENRIDVFNRSGELIISYPFTISGVPYFFMVNGMLYYSGGSYIMLWYLNGKFYNFFNANNHAYMYSADLLPPYYPATTIDIYSSLYGVSHNPYLSIASNYLATINNLSEPLEKTNEHTLKITYDITH